jgi:hypothetical protein
MSSLQLDTQQRRQFDETTPVRQGTWRLVKALWCRHTETAVTPKTDSSMPAHLVCQSCGWREPVVASVPRGTRTWDSSRDEARYEREKRRRAQMEVQKQEAIAQWAAPAERTPKPRRLRRSNLVEMKRVVGQ